MEKIGAIPTPTLTDREILLLTYQQLQGVSEEFRAYKMANDVLLHDLQERMSKLEQHLATNEVLKEASEIRNQKQLRVVGVVITVVNLLISAGVQYFSHKGN